MVKNSIEANAHSKWPGLVAGLAVGITLLVAGCLAGGGDTRPVIPAAAQTSAPPAGPATGSDGPAGTSQALEITATPAGAWQAMFQRTPYPYASPLPPPNQTSLDGTYTKEEPFMATPVHCLRCPDYAPEGGVWKLSLDKGIFRIFYEGTGWRSMGSFTVEGDRLTLFNDPNCTDVTGTYTWELQEGNLVLREVEDPCAIHLRAINLTQKSWLSCRPPNPEAMVTDHWPKPAGCE